MEKTFNFVFTEAELNLIFSALTEKPYKDVANVIDNIRNQYNFALQEEQRKAEALLAEKNTAEDKAEIEGEKE